MHLELELLKSPHKTSSHLRPALSIPKYPRNPPTLIMEIEILPVVSLLPIVSVLIAPEEMLRALNGNPHLQQSRILFIAGIRSGILGRLDRSSVELDVRRAFTSVQLRTILEENHHSFLIVEHRRYERARDMAGHVAQAMKQASRGEGGASSCTPLYWTGTWRRSSPTGSSASMICREPG